MKRMDEVFDLPVSSMDQGFYTYDVFQAGGDGEWSSTFCTTEQAQQAVRAINHADMLADALDECLEEMELEGKHTDRTYMLVKTALAAYRGGK